MELPLRIRYGLGGIISHPQRARLVERRAQSIGLDVRRSDLFAEELLGYGVDDGVHQIHHLYFRGTAHHAHRGARNHKFIVVLGLKGDGDRVILKVRQHFADCTDGHVHFARGRLGEDSNVVQVGYALKKQGIGPATAEPGGNAAGTDLHMEVYRTAISEIGSAPHQQGSQFLVFQRKGSRQYGSEAHVLAQMHQKI